MIVKFYKNKSSTNVINKLLSKEKTFDAVRLVDECTLIEPSLLMSLSDITDFAIYNYFYIPKFDRYYHVTNMTFEDAFVKIDGNVDVLMSFKADILGSTQLIDRQEKKVNKWLIDTQAPITSKRSLIIKTFGDPFDTNVNTFCLQTTGKGGGV